MKVLLTHRPGGAYGYISESWSNTLKYAGIEVSRWDGKPNSWDAFQPDLYIGCSGHQQPIPTNRGNTKIAIHCNPYGPVDMGPINEPAGSLAWIIKQKPDAVFGYGHENNRNFWKYYESKGIAQWVPMATAGDPTIYKVNQQAQRTEEIVYLGGYWAYKGQHLNKYLMPLLTDKNIKSTVYGWGDWPTGISKGILPETIGADKDFYNTGLVAPCICEPHTSEYGIDVPERVFKAALCGCYTIHEHIPGFSEQFMSSTIIADSVSTYHDAVREAIANRRFIDTHAALQRQQVLEKDTYFHRLSGLFKALGFTKESQLLLNKVEDFKA